MLTFMVFAFSDPSNAQMLANAVPWLVGGVVMLLVAQFGPITGCGMNTARDLGPRAVIAMAGWGPAAMSSGWWVYSIGPIIGAVIGGAGYDAIFGHTINSTP